MLGMTKSLFAEHILGKNHTWAPFVVPSLYPCAFVVMANAQTSRWGQIADVLFFSVHFLFLLDYSLKQRVWGEKREENCNKTEGMFQANNRR